MNKKTFSFDSTLKTAHSPPQISQIVTEAQKQIEENARATHAAKPLAYSASASQSVEVRATFSDSLSSFFSRNSRVYHTLPCI